MYEDNLDTLCPMTFAEQIQICYDVACGVERLHNGSSPVVLSGFTKYDVLVTDSIRGKRGVGGKGGGRGRGGGGREKVEVCFGEFFLGRRFWWGVMR